MRLNILKILILIIVVNSGCSPSDKSVLKADDFKHYVDLFNQMEDENILQAIPNDSAWKWMQANIPLFECPQKNFEEIYYYRWWTLRKHIKETPVGYAMTEFLVDRSYSDKYNLIACAIGHHIAESRWLHDDTYMDDYLKVWYRGNEGKPMNKLHKFSSWTPWAAYHRFLINRDTTYLLDLYPDFVSDYQSWERERRLPSGLFWQEDVKDGMEEQISGGRRVKNARPTINSYMFGNALAIAKMADMNGEESKAKLYRAKADTIKSLVDNILWNPDLTFYETLREDGDYAGVREAIGYIPWFFDLPGEDKSAAWKQVTDPDGFCAPFGLTTAEMRHPEFRKNGCCNCEWDGAVWPFATSQTLTGLANLLNDYDQNVVNDSVYFDLLETYVESQYYRGRPYIGEYLDEQTGYWLKGDQERSRYYNHSTFNDLIITGLVGLRPRADNVVEVNPLVPAGKWSWFALDNVKYQGRILTIIWDDDGSKYGKGAGLQIFADGQLIAASANLEKVTGEL
ncbi:MAG: glycoside hydrolase [Cyclobacteriaceae bacterium]